MVAHGGAERRLTAVALLAALLALTTAGCRDDTEIAADDIQSPTITAKSLTNPARPSTRATTSAAVTIGPQEIFTTSGVPLPERGRCASSRRRPISGVASTW
jgi:hypothetical protein